MFVYENKNPVFVFRKLVEYFCVSSVLAPALEVRFIQINFKLIGLYGILSKEK